MNLAPPTSAVGGAAVLVGMHNAATAPRARAITLAREAFATQRHTRESACEMALAAVPELKLSRDQLKALAFGAVLHGFGERVD